MQRSKIAVLSLLDISILAVFTVLVFWSTRQDAQCRILVFEICYQITAVVFMLFAVSQAVLYVYGDKISFPTIIAAKIAGFLLVYTLIVTSYVA